ncbi:hypothetical protein SeLEV6574_g04249 [Synchytrium endobioticum]|uniref:Uncharacterized protein n=1 Tax=Synchytrium endobioticum TaxID=286115 RepID=A0A507D0D0_9FUNG|nr:hypothetical protein SeLEV6574_g04239 [Synchytrium endobioticum]TPX44872.1 hypothetical protein SeLEV6574_g04249 [Synchytrium endobioticum]
MSPTAHGVNYGRLGDLNSDVKKKFNMPSSPQTRLATLNTNAQDDEAYDDSCAFAQQPHVIKLGVRYQKPTLYLFYRVGGKERRRKIPVRALDAEHVIAQDTLLPTSLILRDLMKRHTPHLSQVSSSQLQRLINRMRLRLFAADVDKNISQVSEGQIPSSSSSGILSIPQEQLPPSQLPPKDASANTKSTLPPLLTLRSLSTTSSLPPLSKSSLVSAQPILDPPSPAHLFCGPSADKPDQDASRARLDACPTEPPNLTSNHDGPIHGDDFHNIDLDVPDEEILIDDELAALDADNVDNDSDDEEGESQQLDNHWLAALSRTTHAQPSEPSEMGESVADDDKDEAVTVPSPTVPDAHSTESDSKEAGTYLHDTPKPSQIPLLTSSSASSLTDLTGTKIPIHGRSTLTSRVQTPPSNSNDPSTAGLLDSPSLRASIALATQTGASSGDDFMGRDDADDILDQVMPGGTGTGAAGNRFYEQNDEYSDDFGAGDTKSDISL